MDRFLTIHGHFYQPPRENPWLEAIEMQDSAYPYHDWNERVSAECYAPNARSRLLDSDGRIDSIVNNYSRINFNVGPTLLAWMEHFAADVYQAIVDGDKESRRRYGGHGSAIAQPYNHMILPLANRRDKETQIVWGIRDFEHRFRRTPQGMWLPETAVDNETLGILAAHRIKYTILSPYQAMQVRAPGSRLWRDAGGGAIDPSMPYRVRVPGDRMIAVFFYDGPISRAIAFEDLLTSGENFAHRMLGAFNDSRGWAQLSHVATDGETYGHHKKHGDMALAYALHYIEKNSLARLTNYAEFLKLHPPKWEARIVENSSWSCAHGIERWRSDCGCNAGHPGWRQHWRAPLREALDWLRDTLAPLYESEGGKLLVDPWAARDDYVSVLLNRGHTAAFLERHQKRQLEPEEAIRVRQLLEMQRHAMLMYTSCGWFFDELSGMETVQVIQYAARALQLARENGAPASLEDQFLERLAVAPSNIPEHGDGQQIYEKFVRPAMVDVPKVAAHYGVSAIFDDGAPPSRVYCYDVEREDFRLIRQGRSRLGLGRVRITSSITGRSDRLTFGVLHMGDHNVIGGVRPFRNEEAYRATLTEAADAFQRADLPALVRAMDKQFGAGAYSLRLLFRDEQRRIVALLLEQAMNEAEALDRGFYRSHSPLVRHLHELNIPLPRRFQMAVDFTLNSELRAHLATENPDHRRIDELLEEMRLTGINLDTVATEFALRRNIERAARRWQASPDDLAALEHLAALVEAAGRLPFAKNLWFAQNLTVDAIAAKYRNKKARADSGDPDATTWIERIRQLAAGLRVRAPE
jgi:alpha-amylase/alpha-mannosidase (GH57 family)